MQDVYKMAVSSPVLVVPCVKEPMALPGALLPFSIPLHRYPSPLRHRAQPPSPWPLLQGAHRLPSATEIVLLCRNTPPSASDKSPP